MAYGNATGLWAQSRFRCDGRARIEAEPAIYADDVADQVREQLLYCDGVLAITVTPSQS
jgi:hypothetical protein